MAAFLCLKEIGSPFRNVEHTHTTTMSSWMGWFEGGRHDHQKLTRDAVVDLRSSLLLLEKREDYMQKQIDEETRKAKANATSNKRRECIFPGLPHFACNVQSLT